MSKKSKLQIPNVKLKRRRFIIFLAALLVFLIFLLYPKPSTQNPSYSPSETVKELTEEEKFILDPPISSATSAAKEKHQRIVAKLASEAATIEIKDCRPTPTVVKTQIGSEIKIKNYDSVERKILIDSKNIFTIPAKEEKVIETSFKYGSGDYGYVCEGSGIVGFLHVIK